MRANRLPSSVSSYVVLLKKDFRQEFRTREMLTAMGLYAVLILIVYGATVATSATALDLLPFSSGLFWTMLVFTSLLGLNRTFNHEQKNAAIEGLLIAPIDRSAVFLAKTTANTLFMLAIEIVCVPLYWFLFLADVVLPATAPLALVVLLVGTIGVAGIGTLLSTITMHTRGKDVLLAVLMIPLIYPLLYSCVAATGAVLVISAGTMDVFLVSLALAAGYDVIMLAVAWVLYGFVLES